MTALAMTVASKITVMVGKRSSVAHGVCGCLMETHLVMTAIRWIFRGVTAMFYTIFELFFLVFGMFLQEPQLLIAAGAFAIAEELSCIEEKMGR